MNKQYKLTDNSKFVTVLKAAAEYGIGILYDVPLNLVNLWWKDAGKKREEWLKVEEVPEFIQHIVDNGLQPIVPKAENNDVVCTHVSSGLGPDDDTVVETPHFEVHHDDVDTIPTRE